MPTKSMLLMLVVAGLIQACAQTTVRDCRTADWFGIGQRDGLAGAPETIFDSYRAACREAGIVPDREAYENGRQEGLQAYCTDARGFEVGRGRGVYHHVCPPELEKRFLAGRARGMRLAGCQAEIYVFDEHLASLEHALKSREADLANPQTSPATQVRLRREIEELEALYRRVGDELAAVELRCMEQSGN